MEDWYNISRAQIEKYEDGKKMISKFKRLCFALQFAFPDYPWNVQKFSKKLKKSSQRWLLLTLKNIYTHGDCFLEDHVLYYDLIPVELDIYLPNLQLAFEYQGEQHYHDLERIFGKTYSLGRLLFRDHKKKECSNKFGINLITVPYWWDHEELSLREIITLQMKE
eukprot:TRINITY_DN389_c0_g1_i1.p2 TRINITY_DN389_c0_g1~~TRINITY_DN389_c0_g1_i1.p2  ORF type:complete len:165 (+),score=28.73 TRINITY_DN389_c0_g1_i1:634-1128(+)